MDFTLALTHFCEVHGPKSVLCTQVLPLDCALCSPPSPTLRSRNSTDSFATRLHVSGHDHEGPFTPSLERSATADTDYTLSTGFSAASTTIDSEPESPSIERHPLFKATEPSKDISPQFKYGRAQGETCASCAFTVPSKVTSKLPEGAPGSFRADGRSKNGAPVLRSREFVCLGSNEVNKKKHSQVGNSSSQESSASSFQSYGSSQSHTDCHDHTLTYLTAKSPDDPENYSQLRASVIRTLSCEILPRGMSDGPFCFGDSHTGYTIAYVFRLTDPKARGRRRAYAFVALAGKDANRAFKACPMLWEAFSSMASSIEQAAQQYQDELQRRETDQQESAHSHYTPVSSFLTQRTTDPDGHPRRAGQPTPRNLAEIVGDENIFAILHQYFVHILRCLGDRFGGLPLADSSAMYQSFAEDEQSEMTKKHISFAADQKHSVVEGILPVKDATDNDIENEKIRARRKLQQSLRCGPTVADATTARQVF